MLLLKVVDVFFTAIMDNDVCIVSANVSNTCWEHELVNMTRN